VRLAVSEERCLVEHSLTRTFSRSLGALLIGMTVDPRNPDLVSGTGNANSSPWVLAIKTAGIPALDSVVNACILVSAWSAGNSYCWVRPLSLPLSPSSSS